MFNAIFINFVELSYLFFYTKGSKKSITTYTFILENDNFDQFIEFVNNVFLIYLFNLDRNEICVNIMYSYSS